MVASTDIEFFETEFGKRPKDWLTKPISAIVSDFRGGAPLAPSDFKEFGFLVLPKGGVLRGGNLLVEKDKQQYCSLAYAERHKSNIVDKEYTIVVLRDLVPSGPNIGLVVRINSNEKYILAQGVYGFKVHIENYSSDFLIHLSNTNEYRKVMRNIMVGSTQVHITNNSFLKVEIPLPPLKSEQTAIATALSDTDALISSLEKLIEKKRATKQGAMQQLLTPKEGWEVKRLGEVLKIRHGKSQRKVEDSNGQFPILGTGGLMSYTNHYLYDMPSVLIGRKGTIDKPQFMDTPFWTVDTLFYTEINTDVSPKFIYYRFLLINWYSHNEASGVPSLNAKTIENIEISIPSFFEQTRIASILSDMDKEIESLEQKLSKYKMIKLGMMQELLTGKIRLI